MKETKNYYLIIPASNITSRVEGQNISDIFKSNNVSEENQKIILKLFIRSANKHSIAYELITKQLFYFDGSIIKAILSTDTHKTINIISETSIIDIHPKFVTASEIKKFYQEIAFAGEEEAYINAVNEVLLSNKKENFPKRKIRGR